MRCIWAVACNRGPDYELSREEWTTYIKEHPELLSWDEYSNNQHEGAYNGISRGAHLIAKHKDKAKTMSYVTAHGAKWCREHIDGILE